MSKPSRFAWRRAIRSPRRRGSGVCANEDRGELDNIFERASEAMRGYGRTDEKFDRKHDRDNREYEEDKRDNKKKRKGSFLTDFFEFGE